MKKNSTVLPISTKPSEDPLHLSDMHTGSEAYQIDLDTSYNHMASPMKII